MMRLLYNPPHYKCTGLYYLVMPMLMRCMKAYSSSCLQTVSLSPTISSQFILGVCAAAEDRKNQ